MCACGSINHQVVMCTVGIHGSTCEDFEWRKLINISLGETDCRLKYFIFRSHSSASTSKIETSKDALSLNPKGNPKSFQQAIKREKREWCGLTPIAWMAPNPRRHISLPVLNYSPRSRLSEKIEAKQLSTPDSTRGMERTMAINRIVKRRWTNCSVRYTKCIL